MLPLVVSCAVRRVDTGAVLFIQRPFFGSKTLHWALPGGKVGEGEDPFEALLREMHEEADLTLDPATFIRRNFYIGTVAPAVVLFYEAPFYPQLQTPPRNMEAWKHPDMAWFTSYPDDAWDDRDKIPWLFPKPSTVVNQLRIK